MKLAVACEHRGYEAKRRLLPVLKKWGHQVTDFGCDAPGAVDYPDLAIPASRAVINGTAEAAILLDGSGIGMSIAANKVFGVRAALAHDEVTARIEHAERLIGGRVVQAWKQQCGGSSAVVDENVRLAPDADVKTDE